MELDEKVDSISDANLVAEFNTMLDQHHISTSWWGQRLVSIDGYEGEIEINKLAKKYLDAAQFHVVHDTSLQIRLDYAYLRERIEKLYIDSDNQLKESSIYHIVVPILEYRPYCKACAGDPQAIIRSYEDSEVLVGEAFAFSPNRFKEYWDGKMRIRASFEENYSDGTVDIKWYASKEMVESALTAQH